MLSITETSQWKSTHPAGMIGLLELSGVDNAHPTSELETLKRETEAGLRTRYQGFSRQDFVAIPIMAAYKKYYQGFKKTYHVLQQVESIALKGKNLPKVSPLVDANFIAEMETFVLTAGHDVAKLKEPIQIDVSREGDQITQMNGVSKPMRVGDMVMRDADGVSCSIIYGQDNRSPITPKTSHVLYVAYAPVGVPAEAVDAQLGKIEELIRLFSPTVVVKQRRILSASLDIGIE